MGHAARDDIITLATADLAEISGRDLRRWVAHVVVHAMMSTRAGPLIDRLKLHQLVDAHFEDLLKGTRFDFAPVLAALLRIPGVQEADLYVGAVSLIGQLASMNIVMEEPSFRLSPAEKAELIDDAYAETERAREHHHAERLRHAVRELKAKRLGELLVDEGLIDEAQLREGLEAQAELGGRLGSNLVRMGYLEEEDLAAFLGRQLGLPCLTRLERVSPEAIRRLPKHLAEKHQVLPISVTDREIGLAMADPADLRAMDEVRFTTGLRVRPAVAPELLIQYALARFYGVRSPLRLRRLDVHRARLGSDDLVPGPVSLNLDLLTADLAGPSEDLDPVRPEQGLAGCAARLAEAKTAQKVLDIVQEHLSEAFAVSAVFTVDGSTARGCSAAGIPQGGLSIEIHEIDVHDHPILSDVFVRRGLYVGAEPPGHAWLSKVLSVPEESLFTVLPVLEHDRLAAIVVANGRRGAQDDPMAHGQALAQVASTALSMVSLRRALLGHARGGG